MLENGSPCLGFMSGRDVALGSRATEPGLARIGGTELGAVGVREGAHHDLQIVA